MVELRFDFDISDRFKQAVLMAKSPLGRGLSALLSGEPPTALEVPDSSKESSCPPLASEGQSAEAKAPACELRMDQIRPCPFQPRKEFDDDSLKELAASIQSQGVVQPLIVRPSESGYELIAGERRWRAAQLAGLVEVPTIIREASDSEVIELALVENLQRENLNPIEEAVGYQQLIDQFNLRQGEAAQKVGKSRASVANALRLLKLPAKVQTYLKDGLISVGHAKVILGLPNERPQEAIAHRVVKDRLSVRDTEALVAKSQSTGGDSKTSEAEPKDPILARLEEKICQRVSTKVRLRYHQGKGSLEIKFFSDEDLERILQLLGIEPD
ncbi:MAG: putative chromosome-partitioning protein ParB [Verrucomicrobia subdivision 3 bacterium]|nr:putative chromosome-partitioning protein ParB [Limisphaerales bacterium]MCS1417730.1 putative chromosome-partitioning protein ParB [Limisphaerales bacterium]